MRDRRTEQSLAELFRLGVAQIPISKASNIFEDLDKRAITADEQAVIDQRVALQRSLLEQYERRERQRKVKQVRSVCPQLSNSEVEWALAEHDSREEETVTAICSDAAFQERLHHHFAALPASPPPTPPLRSRTRLPQQKAAENHVARRRPEKAKTAPRKVSSKVYVGTFRGRQALGQDVCVHSPHTPAVQPKCMAGCEAGRGSGEGTQSANQKCSVAQQHKADHACSWQTADGDLPQGSAAAGLDLRWPRTARRAQRSQRTKCRSFSLWLAQADSGCAPPAADTPSIPAAPAPPVAASPATAAASEAPERLAAATRQHTACGPASVDGTFMPRLEDTKPCSLQAEDMAHANLAPSPSDTPTLPQLAATTFRQHDSASPLSSSRLEAGQKAEHVIAPPQAPARVCQEGLASRPSRASAARAREAIKAAAQFRLPVLPLRRLAPSRLKPGLRRDEQRAPQKKRARNEALVMPALQQHGSQQAGAEAADEGTNGPAPARKPKLGRVKRCSNKQVDIVAVGSLRLDPGWHNAGCIFPDGFTSNTTFRSSVQLHQLCGHTCRITGCRGKFWPQPTFEIVAADQPRVPLIAKSATGAWNAVLARINAAIDARRKAGEKLPPPPKTAIAGPEYFGLTHPAILPAIEALDPQRQCSAYWTGKDTRQAFGRAHGVRSQKRSASRAAQGTFAKRSRTDHGSSSESEDEGTDESSSDDADPVGTPCFSFKWSGVDRAERRRQRHAAAHGSDHWPPQAHQPPGDCDDDDADNPLPGRLDPITLQAMRRPAVSVYGHVLGMATWSAVLADSCRCPFTQQPLQRNQVTLLTLNNIERFRERLILP